jgi:hypothetical protein
MTTQEFTTKKGYDKGYGYQLEYVLKEWSITKISYNSWGISRNNTFMYSVPTLKIAKNVVLGTMKIESKR